MPMPKLLKKLSRKSLRGHDSDHEHESESEAPPALPLTEYDSLDENGHRTFSPPLKQFPGSGRSSPANSSHTVNRSLSAGAVATFQTANGTDSPAHSRQASYADNTHARASYAPPSGPPPPRSRTTSYGSNRASYFEADPRAKVYSPSQLGYQSPLVAGSPLTASPTPQTPEARQAPDDELSKSLAGAWEVANTAPKTSKVDQVLLVAGEFSLTAKRMTPT
jgi:hypothetical protein